MVWVLHLTGWQGGPGRRPHGGSPGPAVSPTLAGLCALCPFRQRVVRPSLPGAPGSKVLTALRWGLGRLEHPWEGSCLR